MAKNEEQKGVPREYYLQYADKIPEQDIIAATLSVPFQPVRTFPANTHIDETKWQNMLIFGDNLQAIKHLLKLKKEGKLKNPDGSNGIKLVYIDPPFGTGDQYDASGDKPAYSAKLMGAGYLEFLRKRLVLLRELLTDDGSIYVRIDYHFGHYVKAIMDEVYDKNHFVNEIIVNRGRNVAGAQGGKLEVDNDFILFYSKSNRYTFNDDKIKIQRPVSDIKWTSFLMAGERNPRERTFLGKPIIPPAGQHFSLIQDKVEKLLREYHLRLRCRNCGALYYYGTDNHELMKKMKIKENRFKFYDLKSDAVFHGVERLKNCVDCEKDNFNVDYLGSSEKKLSNIWLDIESYSKSTGYPTENSEDLLNRVIAASSNDGELVLDCFAGAGTTGVVAEKLNRHWIMVDVGKLSMYVIQKRLMSLKSEIGNKGKELKPQPFVIYNAGLYDYDLINKMGEQDYKKFCLELFQVEPDVHKVNGFQMDGMRDGAPVHIFMEKYLTEEFVESLHETVGDSLTKKMFIIAPSQSVKFFEDYMERDGVRYYVLRIPYSIIDEIEKRDFTPIKQPDCADELNDIVDAVGFDFIEPPDVDCEYSIERPKDKLVPYAKIQIKKFKSNQRSKKEKIVPDEDAMSMVLVDRDYNGDYFRFTDRFFKCDIEKNTIMMPAELGKKVAIIYIDIYGNEKFDVVDSKVFKK